jgi:enamine deaminase RidA (YjgF/YER057c/UK114 family)
MYLTSADDADAVSGVHGALFSQILPAATMIVVAGLLDPRWRIEIEVDALIGQQPKPSG